MVIEKTIKVSKKLNNENVCIEMLYILVFAIQNRISSYIPFIVVNVLSKTCGDVLFTYPVPKRSSLMFVQKFDQITSAHSLQDFFVPNSTNHFYFQHVVLTAGVKGIYLFFRHFCCCPVFIVVQYDCQDKGIKNKSDFNDYEILFDFRTVANFYNRIHESALRHFMSAWQFAI